MIATVASPLMTSSSSKLVKGATRTLGDLCMHARILLIKFSSQLHHLRKYAKKSSSETNGTRYNRSCDREPFSVMAR